MTLPPHGRRKHDRNREDSRCVLVNFFFWLSFSHFRRGIERVRKNSKSGIFQIKKTYRWEPCIALGCRREQAFTGWCLLPSRVAVPLSAQPIESLFRTAYSFWEGYGSYLRMASAISSQYHQCRLYVHHRCPRHHRQRGGIDSTAGTRLRPL